ncbi:uncharacterized protein MONBRDRAFT_24065 [Monosiga brevicollis MX1]|uniref:Coiled-coil alpha-helical rod protein 1 n=1 Tax=Monosiga brevicollis TaxID=81824 RepID=A9UUL2_MONBE|nr:uncharacterized protein MONBRDRAFT_24065 [Monosiga brevicollis MX1]EDQ90920.1 predicted protein [Monosiga brevicollis MX1]|eukprot:XP_001744217.1 hypothetical protein [Monosiga brevicollis MX1]
MAILTPEDLTHWHATPARADARTTTARGDDHEFEVPAKVPPAQSSQAVDLQESATSDLDLETHSTPKPPAVTHESPVAEGDLQAASVAHSGRWRSGRSVPPTAAQACDSCLSLQREMTQLRRYIGNDPRHYEELIETLQQSNGLLERRLTAMEDLLQLQEAAVTREANTVQLSSTLCVQPPHNDRSTALNFLRSWRKQVYRLLLERSLDHAQIQAKHRQHHQQLQSLNGQLEAEHQARHLIGTKLADAESHVDLLRHQLQSCVAELRRRELDVYQLDQALSTRSRNERHMQQAILAFHEKFELLLQVLAQQASTLDRQDRRLAFAGSRLKTIGILQQQVQSLTKERDYLLTHNRMLEETFGERLAVEVQGSQKELADVKSALTDAQRRANASALTLEKTEQELEASRDEIAKLQQELSRNNEAARQAQDDVRRQHQQELDAPQSEQAKTLRQMELRVQDLEAQLKTSQRWCAVDRQAVCMHKQTQLNKMDLERRLDTSAARHESAFELERQDLRREIDQLRLSLQSVSQERNALLASLRARAAYGVAPATNVGAQSWGTWPGVTTVPGHVSPQAPSQSPGPGSEAEGLRDDRGDLSSHHSSPPEHGTSSPALMPNASFDAAGARQRDDDLVDQVARLAQELLGQMNVRSDTQRSPLA